MNRLCIQGCPSYPSLESRVHPVQRAIHLFFVGSDRAVACPVEGTGTACFGALLRTHLLRRLMFLVFGVGAVLQLLDLCIAQNSPSVRHWLVWFSSCNHLSMFLISCCAVFALGTLLFSMIWEAVVAQTCTALNTALPLHSWQNLNSWNASESVYPSVNGHHYLPEY